MMDPLVLLPEHHQKQFDSRFRIVLIAAQRAKQMIQGPPTEGPSKFRKETSQALEEVLKGDVSFLVGQEARQALKESHSVHEREFAPSLLAAKPDETSKEIQKELSVYIDDSSKSEEESEAEESS